MKQIHAKVKKWGHSLGIILPKKIVDAEHIREGLDLNITIQPKTKMSVKDLFTFSRRANLPKLKKKTDHLMKEIDKELWPD